MSKIVLLGIVLGAWLSAFTTDASAAVACVRGVYRAGCVHTNGRAVIGHGSVYRRGGTVVRGYRGPVRSRTVIRRY